MDVSAEAADVVVRESLQATEAAAKLTLEGVKNVAALLLAIAKQDMKVVGQTTAKRLARDPAPAVVIPIKAEDKAKFQKLAKEFGVLYFFAQNGSLGTLEIPAIGLKVKIVQGTDNAALAKGAGHFTSTSIWNGNVALAGHNRGVNNHFGKIHTLDTGNTITLTTALGTRTYAVTSVAKVDVMDNTMLEATSDNCITLFTCVMNQPSYRWCVRAVET